MDCEEKYQVTDGKVLIMMGIEGIFQTSITGVYANNRCNLEQATRLLRQANWTWFGDAWAIQEANGKIFSCCSWCGDPILDGQPKSESYDGEIMHFGCACQADDADIGDCSNS